MNNKPHTFHIPVMGTGFSIDTPIKVAKYGISSVISLVDDTLIESMRKFYCKKTGKEYKEISKSEEDYRAKRITAYLNLVDDIVKKQFAELKSSAFDIGTEITKYFEMLSDSSPLKMLYNKMLKTSDLNKKKDMQEELRTRIVPGNIDVNIMTKIDRTNYDKTGKELPAEFTDALAAFRGFAKSKLSASIVFSAGINQRLYSYAEEFKDFYADAKGVIKKKIILKVSDFRSSIIQGKFFAKKGLWISEYRVESGLNCGGHAFASNGYLMGPILEEFKNKRQELIDTLHTLYNKARALKNKVTFSKPHELLVTAQGGIGTAKEDSFLRKFFNLDGTGWATPFLFVPEAVNVDEDTARNLYAVKEDDLYLSDVSPVGVPFNNMKSSSSEKKKHERITDGSPGSPCPQAHLSFNSEFTEKPICVASRQYQKKKVEELDSLGLPKEEYDKKYEMIIGKSCICHDLGASPIIINQIEERGPKRFTAICPGPNAAYFSGAHSLSDMAGHIYGRTNLIENGHRPNMFMQEMSMYIDCLKDDVRQCKCEMTSKQVKCFKEFRDNLSEGIVYYRKLFVEMVDETKEDIQKMTRDLDALQERLDFLVSHHKLAFASA